MRNSERHLYVYQNGSRSVMKLSETRLSSTSPLGGLSSSFKSRHTPLHPAKRVSGLAHGGEAWEAMPTSPLSSTALEYAPDREPQLSAVVTECTAGSPLPRLPSELLHASVKSTKAFAVRANVAASESEDTLAEYGTSRPGLSFSPQVRCATTAAASTSSFPSASVHLLADATPAALLQAGNEDNIASQNARIARSPSATPSVLVSCDASCIACSPPDSPIEEKGKAKVMNTHASEKELDCFEGTHANAGKRSTPLDSSEKHVGVRTFLSRRSGEVSVAERVLFRGRNEDEDANDQDTFNESINASSIESSHAAVRSPKRLPSEEHSQVYPADRAALALETFQAHTPPRLTTATEKVQHGNKPVTACNLRSLLSANNTGSSGSTLSCTCAPGDALACKEENSRNNTHASWEKASLCRATQSSNATILEGATHDCTAMSKTAADLSSIAHSRNVDEQDTVISKTTEAAGQRPESERHFSPAAQSAYLNELGVPATCTPSERMTVSAAAAKKEAFMTTSPTSTSTLEEKTPTPSPHRQELLRRLLAHAAASATHTPCTRTSSPSADAGAALRTPTPRPSRRMDAASTPNWDGVAQITGFPTPVKVSPIPTKAYAMLSEMVGAGFPAEAAALYTAATPTRDVDGNGVGLPLPPCEVTPCTPPSGGGLLSSPTLSAIESEEGDGIAAVLPPNRASGESRAPDRVGMKEITEAEDFTSTTVKSVEKTTTVQADGSSGSECSVSPIQARAGQTTRVWTPQPSDASQGQLPPFSSLSGINASHNTAAQVATTTVQQTSHLQSSSSPPGVFVSGAGITVSLPTQDAQSPQRSRHGEGSFSSLKGASLKEAGAGKRSARASASLHAVSSSPPSPLPLSQAQPPLQHLSVLLPHATLSRGGASASPDLPAGESFPSHRHSDPMSTGRTTPRLVVDTLNLGTPTVSMIHSPAQALNDSCSFVLGPTATQYIQALPIPGMRSSVLAQREVGEEQTFHWERSARVRAPSWHDDAAAAAADELWLCLDNNPTERVGGLQKVHNSAVLVSPAFDDGEADTLSSNSKRDANAAVTSLREKRLPRPILVSPVSDIPQPCRSVHDSIVSRSTPKAPQRTTRATQTSCRFTPVASAAQTTRDGVAPVAMRESTLLSPTQSSEQVFSASAKMKGVSAVSTDRGVFSSMESLPRSHSHSSSSAAVPPLPQKHQRMGLSSTRETTLHSRGDGRCAYDRLASGAKSLSSTRFIDSWL